MIGLNSLGPLSPRIYGAGAERIIAFFWRLRQMVGASTSPKCEPSRSEDTPSQHGTAISTQSMDKELIERVRELQCEVAQIAAAHRGEMPYRKGDLEKQQRYERRFRPFTRDQGRAQLSASTRCVKNGPLLWMRIP